MSIDLDDPEILKQVANAIKDQIDDYALRTYDDGHRNHLGASIIGHDCARYSWSTFRWLKKPTFTGRMQRLFKRGHLEELRFIEYLRGIGFTVSDRDENGKQYRISGVKGHFGGSTDGVCEFPPSWGIPGKFITEFKTKATGAGFNKLIEKGVKLAANEHWNQMCLYGKHLGITHALYFSVNKNDDSLHVEMVKLDWGLAQDKLRKAEKIIESQTPPEKVSQMPTFFTCKYCHFANICHSNERPETNCRSCINATPIENGKWACSKYGSPIPDATIKTGCATWESIVN